MKKALLFIILGSILLSCEKENGNGQGTDTPSEKGVYILNSGNMNNNDAKLTFYNPETEEVVPDVFTSANGIMLGDTANDMIIYGSKMYIGMTGSKIIFITDLKGKKISQIEGITPRNFTSLDGKVYVTDYAGALVQIDTTSFETKSVKVGNKPEGLIVSDGKIYVANSDSDNNYATRQVSVVDPSTMSVTGTIETQANPQKFFTDEQGELYLISWGNYADVPAAIQKIDRQNNTSKVLDNVATTVASAGRNNKVYMIHTSYDENWNPSIRIFVFDATTDTITGDFITDGTTVENAYSITADTETGRVYIGASDYKTNGDVYIYSEDGKFISKFDSEGLNPMGAYFVR